MRAIRKPVYTATALGASAATDTIFIGDLTDVVAVWTGANRSSGNFDAKIQISPDGTNWFDDTAFTNKTADNSEWKELTVKDVARYARVYITRNGGTQDMTVFFEGTRRQPTPEGHTPWTWTVCPLTNDLAASQTFGPVCVGNLQNVAIWIVLADRKSTGTFDLSIETSPDNSNWTTDVAFSQMTANGTYMKKLVQPGANYIRLPLVRTQGSFDTTIYMTARPKTRQPY